MHALSNSDICLLIDCSLSAEITEERRVDMLQIRLLPPIMRWHLGNLYATLSLRMP